MTEEERRRCIITGSCGGGTGLAASSNEERRAALKESLTVNAETEISDAAADYILGLIDEALVMVV